ncbi:MAG: glycosyltransferase [Lachnospiraceae bacterium]|nr:glycosyltransferase [Lachnospiraceae bacterium]
MNDRAGVSVITVAYNSEQTIKRTIESVLSQTVFPLEYIIIDGGSSDETVSIAESYRDRFGECSVRYVIVSEKDEGIYDAMNKGIALAKGDIIGIINSDDWYEPCAVKTVTDTYSEEPFDIFYADLKMHMPSGGTFIKHARNRRYATSRDWNHPTTFITREVYGKYKYRNRTIHDDYDLILRLKKAGMKTVIRNVVLADFMMNGTSHKRSLKNALSRTGIKYGIYRENGYPPFYFFECFFVELAKLLIG